VPYGAQLTITASKYKRHQKQNAGWKFHHTYSHGNPDCNKHASKTYTTGKTSQKEERHTDLTPDGMQSYFWCH
jgi:hypothetical protein